LADQKQKQQLMVFAGLGFEVVGLMMGSVVIGSVVDDYMKWQGTATMVLIILSFILWLYHIIFMAKKIL